VRGEGDARLAPVREHVEAPRNHFHLLDLSARAACEVAQILEEVFADAFLVVRDRFDVYQRACERNNVHIAIVGQVEKGERASAGGRAEKQGGLASS
jgi:hypothetical protein